MTTKIINLSNKYKVSPSVFEKTLL